MNLKEFKQEALNLWLEIQNENIKWTNVSYIDVYDDKKYDLLQSLNFFNPLRDVELIEWEIWDWYSFFRIHLSLNTLRREILWLN